MNGFLKIILLLAATTGTATAKLDEASVSHLKLRSEVHVRGDVLTLSDVLIFAQADPRLLAEVGDKPVLAELTAPAETQIAHEQVVQRLRELGVNMARVLVSGALACHVVLEPATSSPPAVGGTDGAPLIITAHSNERVRTLADALRAHAAEESAWPGGTIEIEFERGGQEFLALTSPPFDFSVRSTRGQKLGLREFAVTIARDGQRQRTVRIGGRVKLIKQIVVAAKPLNIGSFVKRDSLEYGTQVFTDVEDLGFDHPEQVVGQQVKRFVPPGQMVRSDDLKPVDLVKRSQPVTVLGKVGASNVSIHITGDALDSGGYGETVRVRLGDSRKNRRQVRGVVTGLGTVKLLEGEL